MTPEWALLRAPMRGYADILANPRAAAPAVALAGRLVLVAVVTGCSLAVASTGHITAALVASLTVCWAPLVLLQCAIALAVVGPAARQRVGLTHGLSLFFMAHAPWSLWLLAFASWATTTSPIGQPIRWAELTAIVPLACTARLVHAFHVQVLRCDRRSAFRRTLLHQGLTWAIGFMLFATAVQLWPRIVGLAEQWSGR